MNEVFGEVYSDAYDWIYRDKDYSAECDLIQQLLGVYGSGPQREVLDLGCGTGNHAIPLAQRGYRVTGVDRSEGMLARARQKASRLAGEGEVGFRQGDIRNFDLARTFDAALIMFAVLGYQIENADVVSALKTAKRHLRPGGLLIFDVWYGPAVLAQRPGERVREIQSDGQTLLRTSIGRLDTRRQVCTVQYHLWLLEKERLVAETQEDHIMRFFFPQELALFLELAGFQLLRLGGFPEFDQEPDEGTWNVLGVARSV